MNRRVDGGGGLRPPARVPRTNLPLFRQLWRGLLAASLAGPLWLLLAGCGAQGLPRPPRIEQPQRIEDLEVHQRGRTFVLAFTPPSLATDGERLTKPIEIEILRAVIPRGGNTAQGMSSLKPWKTVLPIEVPSRAEDSKVVFTIEISGQDFRESEGATFAFALRSLTRGFRHHKAESELSNIAHASLEDASEPVQNLQVRTTEKALELAWAPPRNSLAGGPARTPDGYRILKSSTGKPGSFQLLGEATSPAYSDSDFKFGGHYFYKVRAVFKQEDAVAESDDSAAAEVTPRDTFPPATPSDLTAVYSPGSVELVWKANTEPDLAGYNVQRREAGGAFQKVNLELLRTPIFRDTAVEPERHYYYRLTAVDLAGNESPPSEEVVVETR